MCIRDSGNCAKCLISEYMNPETRDNDSGRCAYPKAENEKRDNGNDHAPYGNRLSGKPVDNKQYDNTCQKIKSVQEKCIKCILIDNPQSA